MGKVRTMFQLTLQGLNWISSILNKVGGGRLDNATPLIHTTAGTLPTQAYYPLLSSANISRITGGMGLSVKVCCSISIRSATLLPLRTKVRTKSVRTVLY